MYSYQNYLFKDESIYIAGPECFYQRGMGILKAMRLRSESLGFTVTLPNDNPLDMTNSNKQKSADSIFADLENAMNETTVIIADLESFRGCEVDSGTVFEIGMAYAKGARCYGYTRDKRNLATKNQCSILKDNLIYDERGSIMAYPELPFAPSIIGSTKIIEGDFDDCLKMLMVDIEEESKRKASVKDFNHQTKTIKNKENSKPIIYLSGFERYEIDKEKIYRNLKNTCSKYGYAAITPIEQAPGTEKINSENPYVKAANVFDNYQKHVRNCDVIIANLNNYRGYEVNNDVAFECGMGFQLGKKLYGYINNTDKLIDKIPNRGSSNDYFDHVDCKVEDFDYPVNLMFSCSMKIYEGDFENIIKSVIKDMEYELKI